MEINEKIRQGIIESLPEAKQISNKELRERVYDAWAMALAASGYTKIEDVPSSTDPLEYGSLADHVRFVARLSLSIAKELKDTVEEFRVDMDEVIAGGLCHDLGKPFEYDPKNQERWKSNPQITGYPSMRHSTYGTHIALAAGLPEKIAHIVSAHSKEGAEVERSLLTAIVRYGSMVYSKVLANAGISKG